MKKVIHIFLLMLGVVAVAAADEPVSDTTANGLVTKYNCVSCHSGYDTSRQGPSYRDIAKKYAQDNNAGDALSASVLKGSSGACGSNAMPSTDIPPDDLRLLVEWI